MLPSASESSVAKLEKRHAFHKFLASKSATASVENTNTHGPPEIDFMICVMDEQSSHRIMASNSFEDEAGHPPFAIITPHNIIQQLQTLSSTEPMLLFVDPAVRFFPPAELSKTTPIRYSYAALANSNTLRLNDKGGVVTLSRSWTSVEISDMTTLGEGAHGCSEIDILQDEVPTTLPDDELPLDLLSGLDQNMLVLAKTPSSPSLKNLLRSTMDANVTRFVKQRLHQLGVPVDGGSSLCLWSRRANEDRTEAHLGGILEVGGVEGEQVLAALRDGIVQTVVETRLAAGILVARSAGVRQCLASMIAVARMGLCNLVYTVDANISPLRNFDDKFQSSRLPFLTVGRAGLNLQAVVGEFSIFERKTFQYVDQERARIINAFYEGLSPADHCRVPTTEQGIVDVEATIVESFIHHLVHRVDLKGSGRRWRFREYFSGDKVKWVVKRQPLRVLPKEDNTRTHFYLNMGPEEQDDRFAIYLGVKEGNNIPEAKWTLDDIIWVRKVAVDAALKNLFPDSKSPRHALALFDDS